VPSKFHPSWQFWYGNCSHLATLIYWSVARNGENRLIRWKWITSPRATGESRKIDFVSSAIRTGLPDENPNLGKFWRFLKWKMLVYFMTIWSILWLFGLFYGHLVYFTAIYVVYFCRMVCCIMKNLATLYQKKESFSA
jgi:hypothetical protein